MNYGLVLMKLLLLFNKKDIFLVKK